MASDALKIARLTDDNYFQWVVEAEAALCCKNLWGAVEEDAEFRGLDAADRKKLRREAYGFLVLCISPKVRECVLHGSDTDTPKKLWESLASKFEQRSDERMACLVEQLTSATQKHGESVATFISRVEELQRRLKEGHSENVSDGMMLGIILKGVSSKFDATVEALRCMDSLKLDGVKNKLIAADARHKSSDVHKSKGEPSAFFSKDKRVQQPGASTSHEPRKKQDRRRCYNCGQIGHISANCPEKKRSSLRKDPQDSSNGDAHAFVTTALKASTESHRTQDLFIDTGASHHIVIDNKFFVKMHDAPVEHVSCGGGEEHPVKGAGTVVVQGEHGTVQLLQTLYVPTFKVNLMSGSVACRKGARIEATGRAMRVVHNCRTVISADAYDGLFAVRGRLLPCNKVSESLFRATAFAAPARVWHQRLGHVSYAVMHHMRKHRTASHFDVEGPIREPSHCEECIKGKQARRPFPTSTSATSEPLQLVHADVIGKMPCESIGGSLYILTVRDDFSGYSAVACVKRKSEVGEAFCDILARWARETGKLVKRVRTDGGSEFLGQFKESLRGKGILHERSVRYTPQQNGVAERFNRTLVERMRCMMFDAGLPREFWAEAAVTSCHLHNKVPSRSQQKSPQELFSGAKPNLSSLRTFGCLAFSQVPGKLRSKLDACTEKGVFVGYESGVKGWRIMIPNANGGWRTVVSRDVKFVEDVPGFSVIRDDDKAHESLDVSDVLSGMGEYVEPVADQPLPVPVIQGSVSDESASDETADENDVAAEAVPTAADDSGGAAGEGAASADDGGEAASEGATGDDSATGVRSSNRVRAAPDRYDPSAYSYAAPALTDEPQSVAEVKRRPDMELWEESMNAELTALAEKNVFEWSDLPPGRKALPSRWVFKIKRTQTGAVEKYKSRIVAKGFMQQEGVDYHDVFAPGSSLTTLRMLLSIAADQDLELHQLDVKTAFLNGDLQEEVYLMPPTGAKGVPGKVWRLKKALYGLKQAAQAWHVKLKEALLGAGIVVSAADPCLYVAAVNGAKVYLFVHVDDALIVGNGPGVASVKATFKKLFEARDLGDASLFLGLEIVRDRNAGLLWLGQSTYALNVLRAYNMTACGSRGLPLDANQQLIGDGKSLGDSVPYSAAVGSLLYLAGCTRPDLALSVNMHARFVSAPKIHHWQSLKGVFRYLSATSELGLVYRKKGGSLVGFSDADYAGDPVKRRSTSGYAFLRAGGAVLWGSKLQPTVAASTCEAELIAGSRAVKEALYLRKVVYDFVGEWQAIPMMMDNQSALVLIRNPAAGAQTRAKHIDVAYNFARHRVLAGEICAFFVKTDEMVADVFTKQLPGPSFRKHCANLGLCEKPKM